MYFYEYVEQVDSLRFEEKVPQVIKDLFDANAVPENKRITIFIGRAKPNEPGQNFTFIDNIRTLQGNAITQYPYEGMRNDLNIFFPQKGITEPTWIVFTVELGALRVSKELLSIPYKSWVSFDTLGIEEGSSLNSILLALKKGNWFSEYLPDYEALSYEEFLEKRVELEQTNKKLNAIKIELTDWENKLNGIKEKIEEFKSFEDKYRQKQEEYQKIESALHGVQSEIEVKKAELRKHNIELGYLGKNASESEKLPLEIAPLDIKTLCKKAQYEYEEIDILRFLMALNTSQIIAFCGEPGTGKTTFVTAMSKAIGAKCTIIQVQNNWSDKSDAIGFYNPIDEHFQSTEMLDAILEAKQEFEQKRFDSRLHVICLDEMNLARVEYYFATFLSLLQMEPTERKLHLLPAELSEEVQKKLSKYKDFILPPNVRFVGTMNLDDSTTILSPKVIDRCFFIEFDGKKKCLKKKNWTAPVSYYPVSSIFAPEETLTTKEEERINNAFSASNYRLRTYATEMYKNYKRFGRNNLTEFEDIIVLSKILPAIRLRKEFDRYAGKGYQMSEERFNRIPAKRNNDQWSFWSML